MLRVIALLSIGFLSCSNSAVQAADKCGDILWAGMYNTLEYKSADEFKGDYKKVLNWSREEREEQLKKGEGTLSVGFKKLLTLSLGNESTDQQLKDLKETLAVNESLLWETRSFRDFQLRIVDKTVVAEWGKCMREHANGLNVETVGEKDADTFLVQVTYLPKQRTDPPSWKVTQVQNPGANPKGLLILKPGVEIKQFSSITQLFGRDGDKRVDIVINFDGHPALKTDLAAIRKAVVAPETPEHLKKGSIRIHVGPENKDVRGSVQLTLKDENNTVLYKSEVFPDVPNRQNWGPNQHNAAKKDFDIDKYFLVKKSNLKLTVTVGDFVGKNNNWDGKFTVDLKTSKRELGIDSHPDKDNKPFFRFDTDDNGSHKWGGRSSATFDIPLPEPVK